MLYGISGFRDDNRLYKINTVTGDVTSDVSVSLDGDTASGLIFLPSGEAVVSYTASGGGGALATLDLETGETSNIRSIQGGFVPHGMAMVPEPNSSFLIIFSLFISDDPASPLVIDHPSKKHENIPSIQVKKNMPGMCERD